MMRLHKFLASKGLGSRRAIESWIKIGKVHVNGKVAIIGQQVSSKDKIKIDGKVIEIDTPTVSVPRVLLYHKPEGEICSRVSEEGKKSVFDSLPHLTHERWVMIGRLDVNTSGLLLFTNNGELAHHLMHPSFDITREYAVRVLGKVTKESLANMRKGVELSTGLSRFKQITPHNASDDSANQWFTVSLTQGKYREVRELFASQGYTVSRLIRTKYGSTVLPRDLRKGKYIELTPEKVQSMLPKNTHSVSA